MPLYQTQSARPEAFTHIAPIGPSGHELARRYVPDRDQTKARSIGTAMRRCVVRAEAHNTSRLRCSDGEGSERGRGDTRVGHLQATPHLDRVTSDASPIRVPLRKDGSLPSFMSRSSACHFISSRLTGPCANKTFAGTARWPPTQASSDDPPVAVLRCPRSISPFEGESFNLGSARRKDELGW